VTEQVAEHTNGTIGALLNATFGNAPELLIATAALRSGFYRVVQLTMLGSMLTNLLFVFGLASLVGGLRWQVQELRMSSGNINVGLLLLSLAGSLLPATLVLSGQMKGEAPPAEGIPSKEELAFSRVNAFIMMIMYGCYLVFQLGTHKDEFDDGENTVATPNGNQLTLEPHFTSLHKKTRAVRNMFCLRLWSRITNSGYEPTPPSCFGDVELADASRKSGAEHADDSSMSDQSADSSADKLLPQNEPARDSYFAEYRGEAENGSRSRRSNGSRARRPKESNGLLPGTTKPKKKNSFKPMLPLGLADPSEEPPSGRSRSSCCSLLHSLVSSKVSQNACFSAPTPHAPIMSFRVGILWLFIITLGISALSDILVDTIEGFAEAFGISEVFTSMVILPFFSNIAEQVSAVIFAYRNEMDLCVGVTVGSAIQVATFVLPGCVIIGMFVDRSMTLYFHAYETACLLLAVLVAAAVLQGGTTNWLVGMTMIGIYVMIATGFWFHENEELSIDAETFGT
jgi:Ca2+:H+ antiporter